MLSVPYSVSSAWTWTRYKLVGEGDNSGIVNVHTRRKLNLLFSNDVLH